MLKSAVTTGTFKHTRRFRLMMYLKRNLNGGHKLFSVSMILGSNSNSEKPVSTMGRALPGTDHLFKLQNEGSWRKGNRWGLTRLAKIVIDLGGKRGLPFPCLAAEEGEAGLLLKHSDFSPGSQAEVMAIGRRENLATPLEIWEGLQSKAYSGPFPCGSTERGKAPWAGSSLHSHLLTAMFLPLGGFWPSNIRWASEA